MRKRLVDDGAGKWVVETLRNLEGVGGSYRGMPAAIEEPLQVTIRSWRTGKQHNVSGTGYIRSQRLC